MVILPGLPFRLMVAGIGLPDADGGWRTTRRDYILTGPGGFRSWLRLRLWSVKVP